MTHLCHICLLPIPPNIVMPKHPLFGTKDHIVPRSKGGTNNASNLAPAHYYCNQEKGVKEVTPQMMLRCTRVINRELQSIKYDIVNPKINQFRHMHAVIQYLCRQNIWLEEELQEMYRERGFAR